MATNSSIEWTDHTFNPWRGCSKVHAGCAHCYAETLSKRNPGTLGTWGADGTRIVASEAMWNEPIKWDRLADANQQWCSANTMHDSPRPRVFCASLADVFEEWPGPMLDSAGNRLRWFGGRDWLVMDNVRGRLFALIDGTPNLDWLLLTKRPENVRRMLVPHCLENVPGHVSQNEGDGKVIRRRDNVWIGTSISDQATADKYLPELDGVRDLCPVRFLSCEPLLGPIDFSLRTVPSSENALTAAGIGWVIVGGESGPGARPCNIDWIRSIVFQCEAAGVPCFVKQLGANVVCRNDEVSDWLDECPVTLETFGLQMQGELVRVGLNDGKGGDWNDWPNDLRVREFPGVHA